jgi:hypothetical protein
MLARGLVTHGNIRMARVSGLHPNLVSAVLKRALGLGYLPLICKIKSLTSLQSKMSLSDDCSAADFEPRCGARKASYAPPEPRIQWSFEAWQSRPDLAMIT